jgi:SpoVK/Ycf46/Vps4 family AAA+-type ATPase
LYSLILERLNYFQQNMATARHIIALLSSHNQRDEEQFLSIALQVAAAEARRGRHEVANELKRLVEAARKAGEPDDLSARTRTTNVAIPINRPRGDLKELLSTSYPKVHFDDIVLSADTRARLDRFVLQQRHRDRLREYGQKPSTRLLLVGPPGSGKTLTASAFAGELHLPLFAIRLDTVITRYMGETASKLRLVFDQIAATRGVYLFDEIDAIGGSRTADNDVGEMRRVLNSILQFLEEPNSTDSIIIAATNHPELLDRALFRRFDDIIEYTLPDSEAIKNLLLSRLGAFRLQKNNWPKVIEAAAGLSQADLTRGADEVIKEAILNGSKTIIVESLINVLQQRRALRERVAGILGGSPGIKDI